MNIGHSKFSLKDLAAKGDDCIRIITATNGKITQKVYIYRNGDVIREDGAKAPVNEEGFMAHCKKLGLILDISERG